MTRKHEFNPFYALVVLTAVAFMLTALAYVASLVRLQPPEGMTSESAPQSPIMLFIERRGESLMLYQAAALTVTSLLAMGLDRWRSWQSARARSLASQQPDSSPRISES